MSSKKDTNNLISQFHNTNLIVKYDHNICISIDTILLTDIFFLQQIETIPSERFVTLIKT